MRWKGTLFSGLVEATGSVVNIARSSVGLEIGIESPFHDLSEGESIAVNGACLTVRSHSGGTFTVAAGGMTLERTMIGEWRPRRRVNLERAVRVGDRLGGHIVQGHVDAVADVSEVQDGGDVLLADIVLPSHLADLVVPLGSVAIDGVSLTVNRIPASGVLQVAIIEYTRAHTTLGELRPGDRVHVEVDVLARYVRRLLAPYVSGG